MLFKIATDASQMCTFCHRSLSGGPMSVSKPFGLTLMKYGLTPYGPAALIRILAEMEANGDDSDGDLAGDIVELRAGTDPNVNDITGEAFEQPRHGFYCSTPCRGAPVSTGGAWLTVFLLCAWRIRRSAYERRRF